MDLSPGQDLSLFRYRIPTSGTIEQAALLRDIEIPEVRFQRDGELAATLTPYPWLVVITQDCDLLFDRLSRQGLPAKPGGDPVSLSKRLRSILLCPAFTTSTILNGTYIEGAQAWTSKRKDIVLENREDRYHVLPLQPPLVPESLTVDFKLVIGVHPDYLHQWAERNPERIVAILQPPSRDRLTQRFVNFIGRIAEPDED